MPESTLRVPSQPEMEVDALHALPRNGAQRLVTDAVEVDLADFLDAFADQRLEDGRGAVVRNGYLPARTAHAGIADVRVRVTKVRDHGARGPALQSKLLPPDIKCAQSA